MIHGYIGIRNDRENGGRGGGGCATFIKHDVPYRVLEKGEDLEYIMVVLWERGEEVVIINYYNPCKRLEVDKLLRIQGNNRHKVIWCADFNAHSKIWGGSHTDVNGRVIEDLMDDKELVCINDGRGTRINITTGNESALDTTVGSDHYPVSCSVGERVEIRPGEGMPKWGFRRADWVKFHQLSEESLSRIDVSGNIDETNNVSNYYGSRWIYSQE